MATWTKTNNVITLTQDTTMSELVNDSDIPLVDADTIQLKGHNLIVDIITCGSADPDYNDEVNMGVTVKNDGGGECNLEFKDLSGIRLNATLPGTVHPWVDPDNPLPAFTKDPRKVIHGDPYCTKLTANARVEIQLADTFPLGGGDANLPTETRDGNFYGIIKQNNSGKEIYFKDKFPVHKNDILINYSQHDIGFPKSIVDFYDENDNTFKVTLRENPTRNTKDDTWTFAGGGIVITGLVNFPNGYGCLNAPMNCGCLSIVGQATYHFKVTTSSLSCNRFISCVSIPSNQFVILCGVYGHACINQCSINFVQTNYASSQHYSQGNSISINEICTSGYGGFQVAGSIFSGKTIINGGLFGGKAWSTVLPTIFSGANVKISNCHFYKINDNTIFSPVKLPQQTNTAYVIKNCSFGTIENLVVHNWYENAGMVEFDLQNNSWHHKPNSATATTWKYADHFVPPRKSLHLKISRMVEAASSASEARVAITDTVNWYPETKFGALAEQVISGIETDKWHTYSLKWRNDSDEPQQVRVWECASGSTDSGYLRVEEATGGPM